MTAELDGAAVSGIPAAAADGTTTFDVTIPAGTQEGFLRLAISGDGVAPIALSISVLSGESAGIATTEPIVWFGGFDGADDWTAGGDWAISTRDDVVDAYGTDRRQAFTRATGRLAVAESSTGAFDGELTSERIPVSAGDELEVRVDSHLRVRGAAQSATLTARFDSGESAVLFEHAAGDQESAQLRLPLSVPSGARSVTLEFGFTTPDAAGSWMVDNVLLVRPLAPLAEDATADALVDIFSDIQGSNARLSEQVLPGFRGMAEKANVIVANGDLVSAGSTANYAAYKAAFTAGGGDSYPTSISTIGNHEYYGNDGSEVFRNRFLDQAGMRTVGGQGGLWGEVLVDGRLPLLWVGSEAYDYAKQTGSGPFVDYSDEQFGWLRERLAYWKGQNQPVLLFTHHPLADSVSGTYITFNRNDYGADAERFTRLMSENPNVIMVTSHTHWSPQLNDWSVEHRIDPADAQGLTMVNTGAVTTQYGPSGDWGEAGIGGADPIGVRAALYDDRVRMTVYSFGAAGPTEIKHIDVPVPASDVEPPHELHAAATARCIGGKAYVYASVENRGDAPADVTIESALGTKAFAGVAPGRSVSTSFNSRQKAIPAGELDVSGERDGDTERTTTGYDALTCG
ncbi:metallophosphoesterase [Microbacterium sp. KUDC0406]|uniref:metallophosphoesterase family protein n=1 Tax=Microbacterium sp. KUDC0406 TaxID=2909588 RepID=UPI001F3A6ADA|nr:metallophosphoesterase [Microbacterium sp. KUDC0406]UJP08784.1 metallophosphoesterase [Microbacterium sp. KUDC0406]